MKGQWISTLPLPTVIMSLPELIGKLACGLIVIIFSGSCATAGNLRLEVASAQTIMYPPKLSIELNPGLSYWWGPWEPDLKIRVRDELANAFRRAGITVVERNADVTLRIQEITTGGWTGSIIISKIVLDGFKEEERLFTISYEQHTEPFSVKGFLRPSKDEKQVARLLAQRVIKELKKNCEIGDRGVIEGHTPIIKDGPTTTSASSGGNS